jgi:hypothetical protein
MRKSIVAALAAVILLVPIGAAAADPVIQPVRCWLGDRTGVYVGGKCNTGPW